MRVSVCVCVFVMCTAENRRSKFAYSARADRWCVCVWCRSLSVSWSMRAIDLRNVFTIAGGARTHTHARMYPARMSACALIYEAPNRNAVHGPHVNGHGGGGGGAKPMPFLSSGSHTLRLSTGPLPCRVDVCNKNTHTRTHSPTLRMASMECVCGGMVCIIFGGGPQRVCFFVLFLLCVHCWEAGGYTHH